MIYAKTTPLATAMAVDGIKDRELAKRIGVTRSMITRIRLGVAMPSLPVAVAISDEMGIEPRELVVTR